MMSKVTIIFYSTVGTWYLWTTVRPTCVVQAWNTCSLFWRQTREPPELNFNFKSHRGVNYWSLWAPWPMRSPDQYKPSSPPLLPLSTQPSERRSEAVQLTFSVNSTQLSERSPPLFLLNFNGGEVEERCHLQQHLWLVEPNPSSTNLQAGLPGADCENLPKGSYARACLRTVQELHRTAEPQQEPQPSKTTSLDFEQHINLFPFSWTGNTTGLDNHTRLSKDCLFGMFISLIGVAVIFWL